MTETRYEIDAAGKLYIEGVPAKDFKGEQPKASKRRDRPFRMLSPFGFSFRRAPAVEPVPQRPADAR